MTAIILPHALWEDVEEGTEALLDEWLVAEGDSVEAGQVIARVVLVKTTHDVEAMTAGTITALKVAEEETFCQGAELAELG